MNAQSAATPKKSKLGLPVFLVTALPGIVFLKMGFLFFLLGMLPTFLAMAANAGRRRYVVSTIAAFNFAGVFPELLSLWLQGGNLHAVTGQLSNPAIWAEMYAPAFLGYGLVWISPAVAYNFIRSLYQGRMRHMEQLQKKLEEEWGQDIVDGAK